MLQSWSYKIRHFPLYELGCGSVGTGIFVCKYNRKCQYHWIAIYIYIHTYIQEHTHAASLSQLQVNVCWCNPVQLSYTKSWAAIESMKQTCITLHNDHFVYVPSQWETTLQCNVISHWLSTYTKWSLFVVPIINVSADGLSLLGAITSAGTVIKKKNGCPMYKEPALEQSRLSDYWKLYSKIQNLNISNEGTALNMAMVGVNWIQPNYYIMVM